MGYFEETFAMYSMRYIEMISRQSTSFNARRTAQPSCLRTPLRAMNPERADRRYTSPEPPFLFNL
jgi:hypothetical protein